MATFCCAAPTTPASSPLSLHDALPIWLDRWLRRRFSAAQRICAGPVLQLSGSAHCPRSVRLPQDRQRSEEHTSELQSRFDLVCRLLLEKKNTDASFLPASPIPS